MSPDQLRNFLIYLEENGVFFWRQDPQTHEVMDLQAGDRVFDQLSIDFVARQITCRANRDGDCSWVECPQLVGNGKSCPLRDPMEDCI